MAMDLSYNSLESADFARSSSDSANSDSESDDGRSESYSLNGSSDKDMDHRHLYCQCNRNHTSPRFDFQTANPRERNIGRDEEEIARLQHDASSNPGKRFSIEDILRPDFGRVEKTGHGNLRQRDSDSRLPSRILESCLSSQDPAMGTLHHSTSGSGMGRVPKPLSLTDQVSQGSTLLRPSPLFLGIPRTGIFRSFDIDSQMMRTKSGVHFDEHHHQKHIKAMNDFLVRENKQSNISEGDEELSIPKRLRELVQRDPKRQTMFRYQDNGGSACASLPDRYRDFPRDFPGGLSLDLMGGAPGGVAGERVEVNGATVDCAEEKSWPAWVYCTRYSDRPSAGPRARKIKSKGSRESFVQDTKRPRTAFTDTQLVRLREEFHKNHYLTEDRRKGLAWELGLGETQVKIWFQNKRAKIKKTSDHKTNLAEELRAHGLYNHSVS